MCSLNIGGGPANVAQSRKFVADLIALSPDIIVGHRRHHSRTAAGSDTDRAGRVCASHRSCWGRLCRELGATGRKRYRIYSVRIWPERKMARVAEGNLAGPYPRRGTSRSNLRPRNRATCGDSIRCTVYGRRTAPDRSWRCCRDRARHCGNRSAAEQRCHSDREPFGNYPPQVNYKLGGSSPTACGLSIPLFCHRWRSNRLRAGYH